MNILGTPANLIPGDANRLLAVDMQHIAMAYDRGDTLKDIGYAIHRPIGTVKTATRRLRADGVIGRRYQVHADG